MPGGSHDRVAYLRVAQRYGPILAELRRRHAESAAEYDAKAARAHPDARGESLRPRTVAAEPEPDFSTRTWLR